jgi:hypothetical protein
METEKKDSILPGGSRLTLKPKDWEHREVVKEPDEVKRKARKKRRKAPKPSKGREVTVRFLSMSIGSFLVAALIFGTFLYHQAAGLDWITPKQAEMARGITVVSFLVILIIEAFTEDMMQGILSLFLLPYTFVYGLLFADAGPVRGVTVAMLLFLGAEVYFTPDSALVPKVERTVNGWIAKNQDKLINPEGEKGRRDAGFDR